MLIVGITNTVADVISKLDKDLNTDLLNKLGKSDMIVIHVCT